MASIFDENRAVDILSKILREVQLGNKITKESMKVFQDELGAPKDGLRTDSGEKSEDNENNTMIRGKTKKKLGYKFVPPAKIPVDTELLRETIHQFSYRKLWKFIHVTHSMFQKGIVDVDRSFHFCTLHGFLHYFIFLPPGMDDGIYKNIGENTRVFGMTKPIIWIFRYSCVYPPGDKGCTGLRVWRNSEELDIQPMELYSFSRILEILSRVQEGESDKVLMSWPKYDRIDSLLTVLCYMKLEGDSMLKARNKYGKKEMNKWIKNKLS